MIDSIVTTVEESPCAWRMATISASGLLLKTLKMNWKGTP